MLRQKTRGLHSIGQQKQLAFLEFARCQAVLNGSALILHDVVAELAQTVQIAVERFALNGDPLFRQTLNDLRPG